MHSTQLFSGFTRCEYDILKISGHLVWFQGHNWDFVILLLWTKGKKMKKPLKLKFQ